MAAAAATAAAADDDAVGSVGKFTTRAMSDASLTMNLSMTDMLFNNKKESHALIISKPETNIAVHSGAHRSN